MVQSGGHNHCSPDIRIEGKGGRWGEKERKPFFKYLLRKVTGNCHGTFLILGPNLATGEPGKCSLLPGWPLHSQAQNASVTAEGET